MKNGDLTRGFKISIAHHQFLNLSSSIIDIPLRLIRKPPKFLNVDVAAAENFAGELAQDVE